MDVWSTRYRGEVQASGKGNQAYIHYFGYAAVEVLILLLGSCIR